MRGFVCFLFLIFSSTCYAGRGGYTLGHSPFGDFFAIVLYSIGLVYLYYQFIAHFNEIRRHGFRNNLILFAVLIFYSVPLLIPFLNTTDRKSSSTPSYSPTYEPKYSRTTTRSYSPPKPDYKSIKKPDYKPIEIPKTSLIEFTVPPEITLKPIKSMPPSSTVKSEVTKDFQQDNNRLSSTENVFTDLQDSINRSEQEDFRKKFEADMETARKEYEAYIEANRDKWEAELEVTRKKWEEQWAANSGRHIVKPRPIFSEPLPYDADDKTP